MSTEEVVDPAPEEVINPETMRPEWHLEKFGTIEDQAKAYVELDKLSGSKATEMEALKKSNEEMSGKFGAPDQYTYPEIDGIEWDDTDPMMIGFKEIAKKNDWTQDTANGLLEMYAANQSGSAQAENDRLSEEMKQIPNADTRIKNVQDYISANFKDHAEGLEGIATDAKGLLAVEALLEKAGKAPASPQEYSSQSVPSMEEITTMQMALDENGQRKMANPEYASKVRRLIAMHKGSGDHMEFVS